MKLNSDAVRLAKRVALIAFVVGFLSALLFYGVPATFESHIVCPWCPYVDFFHTGPLLWFKVGLRVGLAQGLAFAVVGFSTAYGFGVLKFRAPNQ